MNFKKLVIASTLGCAAISIPLFFVACGDDSSSSANDDEIADDYGFTLEELEELGIGIYESADDLKKEKCGEENEYESAYVKADSSFYLCYGNKWTDEWGDILSVEIGTVESSDKLGECNEKNEGQMIKVPRDTIFDTYACENGEWVSDFGGDDSGPVDPETVVKGTIEHRGKTYKTVQIGALTWMAENLEYKVKNSYCYGGKDENCEKYGRLYNLSAVTYTKLCPSGWGLPTLQDLESLKIAMGGTAAIAEYLDKGEDPYGMNFQLGGWGSVDKSNKLSYSGLDLGLAFWTKSFLNDSGHPDYRFVWTMSRGSVSHKVFGTWIRASIRCVKK